MSNIKSNSKDLRRKIGNFVLTWEEACKKNGNIPWLVIRTASKSWHLRLRGDMNVTLLWRRLLAEDGMEEFLHTQLQVMHVINTTIVDAPTELFIHALTLGNMYLMDMAEADKDAFNAKRMDIARQLVELTKTILPKEDNAASEISDEEKEILNGMRTAEIAKKDINKS